MRKKRDSSQEIDSSQKMESNQMTNIPKSKDIKTGNQAQDGLKK